MAADPTARPQRKLKRGLPLNQQFDWEPISLDKRESAFASQELIADLIRKNPADIETILDLPKGVDRSVWILDHLKRFLIQLGFLLVHLEKECDDSTCPHMMATENFAYRCSVHGPRMLKNCNAISYALHTLDDFVRKFNHPNYQSRTKIDKKFEREFTQCCRRTYRIFAHAFWHHKNLFDTFENEHYLCTRFIMFIRMYKLIPEKIFMKDKQIPSASLFFDKEQRMQHYKYILFQKEQRLKQEQEMREKERLDREQKENELKNQQNQTNTNNNNNNSNDNAKKPNIRITGADEDIIIKEDSDESSSEDETEQNTNSTQNGTATANGSTKASNGNNPNLDEEAALAEIYSDDPI